jgi:CheY-like chemotaxis protein
MAANDETARERDGEVHRPRVLVIDPAPGICTLLAEVLPHYGLEVETAGFSDAAEVVRSRPKAFALALVSLRGTEGPRTLARLRELEPGLPAVMMTGTVNEATEEGLADLDILVDILALVPKPFKMVELAALLVRLAGRPHADPRG